MVKSEKNKGIVCYSGKAKGQVIGEPVKIFEEERLKSERWHCDPRLTTHHQNECISDLCSLSLILCICEMKEKHHHQLHANHSPTTVVGMA